MTLLDDPVMVLRIQLGQFPCPTCGAHELMPKLQCDYYPDGCLWYVRCGHCQTQYHFDHWTVPARGQRQTGAVIGSNASHLGYMIEREGGSYANP